MKFKPYYSFIASFSALGLVLFKLLYGYTATLDITGADEAGYLSAGIHFEWSHLDGLLYFLYIHVLSFFINDSVILYQVNFAVVTTLFGVAVFVSGFVLTRSSFLSFLISTALLCAWMTVTMWPFISHFNSAMILLTVVAVYLSKAKYQWPVMVLFAALLMYVRPEFFVSLTILVVLALSVFVWDFYAKRSMNWLLVSSIIVAVLLLVFFNPATDGRSWAAFSQHYALGLSKVGRFTESPWIDTGLVIDRDFPKSAGIGSAMIENPTAFIAHLFRNIYFAPRELANGLIPLHSKYPYFSKVVLLLFFLISCLAYFVYLLQQIWKKKVNPFEIFTIAIVVPVIAAILIIFPRPHYFILIVPLLWILGCNILQMNALLTKLDTSKLKVIFFFKRKQNIVLTVGLLLVVFFVPWRANGRSDFRIPKNLQGIHNQQYCTLKDRIQFIRSLPLEEQQIRFLDTIGMVEVYLPQNWHTVYDFVKNEPWNDFIAKNNINALWINPDMLNSTRFRDDSEFQELQANHWSGWQKLTPIECNDQFLLLRQSEFVK